MKTDSMTIDNKELNNVEATKEQTGQTSDTWQAYTKKTHVIGRTVSIITLVMLVGAPFLIGKLLGAYPDLGAAGKGFLSVGNRMAGQQHRGVFDLHTDAGSRRRIPGIYHW